MLKMHNRMGWQGVGRNVRNGMGTILGEARKRRRTAGSQRHGVG